jgi:23S rRNA U2552 (ribose-2'-O)-methylase RlmE/FtsJ
MDPSYDLTVVRPTTKGYRPKVFTPNTYTPSPDEDQTSPSFVPVSQPPTKGNFDPIYVDPSIYRESLRVKMAYDNIPPNTFVRLRDRTNPYEALGSGRYMNRAALKMANIDAVFHLTGHYTTLSPIIHNEKFKYAVVAEGPGGFVQYIQERSEAAHGYGITLMDEKVSGNLRWDVKRLDMTRFDIDYKGKIRGDITKEWKAFTDHVIGDGGRVDLVTADGGIDVSRPEDYNRQEYLSSQLILAEVLMGCILSKPTQRIDSTVYDPETHDRVLSWKDVEGGSLVFKVFDTVTRMSAETIYIATKCFKSVCFFKPVTSRPANSERYVICRGRRTDEEAQPWIDVMKMAMISDVPLSSFLPSLPPSFEKWLKDENDQSLTQQIDTGKKILALYGGAAFEELDVPVVDLPLCFTIWNIPGWRERDEEETCKMQRPQPSKSRRKATQK